MERMRLHRPCAEKWQAKERYRYWIWDQAQRLNGCGGVGSSEDAGLVTVCVDGAVLAATLRTGVSFYVREV